MLADPWWGLCGAWSLSNAQVSRPISGSLQHSPDSLARSEGLLRGRERKGKRWKREGEGEERKGGLASLTHKILDLLCTRCQNLKLDMQLQFSTGLCQYFVLILSLVLWMHLDIETTQSTLRD